MGRRINVATPRNTHDLLRVVNASAPALLHVDFEAACYLRIGQIMEENLKLVN